MGGAVVAAVQTMMRGVVRQFASSWWLLMLWLWSPLLLLQHARRRLRETWWSLGETLALVPMAATLLRLMALGVLKSLVWRLAPIPGPSPAQQGSNCVSCQGVATAGGCQGVWSRRMAFKIVRSLRIQAVRATFLALPAAHSRR